MADTDTSQGNGPINPYDSPHSESDPPSKGRGETPERGGWLVSASWILVILSIMPIIDFLAISRLKGAGLLYVQSRMAFALSIPLAPLVIYFCLNGRKDLKAAHRWITVIGVILGLLIALNLFYILN
jgi:hypothetical protein